MWTIAIPATCVIAHLLLVVIFMPGLWREVDQRLPRWWGVFTLVILPLGIAALIVSHVVATFAELTTWLLVVAFLTVDALLLVAILSTIGLRSRRRRAAAAVDDRS